jgi:UDP-glucose 6-dehydrogenase
LATRRNLRLTEWYVEACWAAQVHLMALPTEQQLSDDIDVRRLANNLQQQQQQ